MSMERFYAWLIGPVIFTLEYGTEMPGNMQSISRSVGYLELHDPVGSCIIKWKRNDIGNDWGNTKSVKAWKVTAHPSITKLIVHAVGWCQWWWAVWYNAKITYVLVHPQIPGQCNIQNYTEQTRLDRDWSHSGVGGNQPWYQSRCPSCCPRSLPVTPRKMHRSTHSFRLMLEHQSSWPTSSITNSHWFLCALTSLGAQLFQFMYVGNGM